MQLVHEAGITLIVADSDDPGYLAFARGLTKIAARLWECLPSRWPVEPPTIVLHCDPSAGFGTLTVVSEDGVVAVLLSLGFLVSRANDEAVEGSLTAKMLYCAQAALAEELYHAWELLTGALSPEDADEPGESNFTEGQDEVVVHYARDYEFRALEFVVEATGQRADLLEEVRIYRAENWCSD